MKGRALPRGASLRLMIGGEWPAWLSLPAGQTEPIHGLPRLGSGYQLIRIAGGWAAQPFPYGANCCAPSPLPVYYIEDGSRAASRIGTADFTAPAAAPSAVWLISYRAGADVSVAAGSAQEVGATGAAIGPRLRLPTGYVIDQGTRAGLLLMSEQTPVRYELWDPATRRVTRSFAHVIAASPTEIAWMAACNGRCLVHVLDLPGGRAMQIALAGHGAFGEGAFSPDGQLLALLVTSGDGRAAANRLIVATVAGEQIGQIVTVPGTKVGGGVAIDFGWQPHSRLVAEVPVNTSRHSEWQIAVWQPGDARLSTTIATTPDQSWPVIDQGPY